MAAAARVDYVWCVCEPRTHAAMPEYDYHCENCQHDFTLDLSITEHERKDKNREIRCPKCESNAVKHVIGSVSVVTSRKS